MTRLVVLIFFFLILVVLFCVCVLLIRVKRWWKFSVSVFLSGVLIIFLPEWFAYKEWVNLCRHSGLNIYEKNEVDGFYDRRVSMSRIDVLNYFKAGYKYVEIDSPTPEKGKYVRYDFSGEGRRYVYTDVLRSEFLVEYIKFLSASKIDGYEYRVTRISSGKVVGNFLEYYSRGGFIYRWLTEKTRDPAPLDSCAGDQRKTDYIMGTIPPRIKLN
ncbi:hypothetical protein K5D33_12900 [Pseudomonas cichorii]|nr:hypothetical protein [Pseudomonas cichorii]MBX8535599.1 hypothetical protein [Pseudomonas cichorii]